MARSSDKVDKPSPKESAYSFNGTTGAAPNREATRDPARDSALSRAVQQIEKQFGKGAVMKLDEQRPARSRASPPAACRSTSPWAAAASPRAACSKSSARNPAARPPSPSTSSPAPRRLGGVAAFIDAEHALDPSWAKRLGVQARRPARQPARHGRTGAGDLRTARPLQRRRRDRDRLGGRPHPAGGNRGRDGRQPRRPAGPADEPGAAEAHRRDQPRASAP